MREKAHKQLSLITIDDVNALLKKHRPKLYDKIIITDETLITRVNFTSVSYKYQKVSKRLKKIIFPNFQTTSKGINNLINSTQQRVEIPTHIFEQISNFEGVKVEEVNRNKVVNAFDYPLSTTDSDIDLMQPKYCFPAESEIKTCVTCHGKKYVKCKETDCRGRHEWTCPKCVGKGKIDCTRCNGSNRIRCSSCGGKGNNKCGNIVVGCNGKGYVMVNGGTYADGRRKPPKQKRCDKCKGKGRNKCTKCIGKGEVICNSCNSRGKVTCNKCSGKTTIVCQDCYGDKQRYGLIDCKTCLTQGKNVLLFYTETQVEHDLILATFSDNKATTFYEDDIKKHISSYKEHDLVYKCLNETITEAYDEYSNIYCKLIRNDLKLTKEDFPKITREEIFYEVIPCIKFQYTHMITGSSHEMSIINFWDNPEIIAHSDAEEVKEDIKNIKKRALSLWGKLLKTKSYTNKEDKFKEIKLLIYIAKADGKIEPSEKIYIADAIDDLKEFTNKEKKKLFNLMDTGVLPQLEHKDVVFSSKERSIEVLHRLKELALADNEYEKGEKLKIQEIENLMSI